LSAPGNLRAAEDTRSNWETPAELYAQLDSIFLFTLDAAADETNTKCSRYLSGPCKGDSCNTCGLHQTYWRYTVWCNPPYGREISDWVEKFAAESAHSTIVALLPANTDTKWFSRVWWTASEIWFLTRRAQFVGTTSSNPGGSMVAIYRPRPEGLSTGPVVRLRNWQK